MRRVFESVLILSACSWCFLGCGASSSDPGRAGPKTGGGGKTVASNNAGDIDEDGIPDSKDLCPEAAEVRNGIDDEDGCPETDLDHDGLIGSADKCPSDPEDLDGYMDEDGCPDVDGDKDGVADEIDKCPTELENLNNYEDSDGCPDTIPPPVKKFTGTIRGIEFKPSSAKIHKGSLPTLDEAAKVLREYRSARIEIQGHTDDDGSRESNLRLSQERADAVRLYLIKKGVDPDRLVARGYGPDEPRGDNKTAEGREQNRRVDFTLISQKK